MSSFGIQKASRANISRLIMDSEAVTSQELLSWTSTQNQDNKGLEDKEPHGEGDGKSVELESFAGSSM